ncbi:MAG: Fn3-like domain-containing protein [Sphingobacteriaceae bacterium]|nr:Fn3-like domain-containing protein [Sphingobacteriaceae bacterium]
MNLTQYKRFNTSLLLCLLLYTTAYGQRLNVNPTILSFNLSDAGAVSTQTITVTNLSDKKQTYQLSLGDWIRDSIGAHRYYAPGAMSRSCARWITFDNPTVEIESQQSRDVRVTLQAPADQNALKEMKWAMIFIQNVLEQTGNEGAAPKMKATIREVFRIGLHVYQTPVTVTEKSAKAIAVTQSKSEPNVYNFSMVNTGKVMLECKIKSVLTNLVSGDEIKLEEYEIPVFPGADRILKLAIPPTVPKGKYSMLTVLDYDADKPLEAVETNIVVQ